MRTRRAGDRNARRKPSRPAASNPLPFLTAALLCTAAVVAIYFLFVRTTVGQLVDEGALREAELSRTGLSEGLADFLDLLPLISVAIAAPVMIFVTLARRRWSAAVVVTVAMAAANLTTQVLKEVLSRPELGVQTLATNSLPSGHATLAASSAAAVFLVVSPRWRPLAAAVGSTFAVAAGVATLVNLWHRPSDIVAAFLIVGAWTALAGWIIMRTGSAWNVWDGFDEHWAASRFWPSMAAVLGFFAGLMAALFVLVSTPTLAMPADPDRLPLLYAGGMALIVSSGYLLAAVGTPLFARSARIRR